jgi:hypothetical protein
MTFDYVQTWIVIVVLAVVGLLYILQHQQPIENDNGYKNSTSSTARTFAP